MRSRASLPYPVVAVAVVAAGGVEDLSVEAVSVEAVFWSDIV